MIPEGCPFVSFKCLPIESLYQILNRDTICAKIRLFSIIDNRNQGGNDLARSHFQFKKRQKELAKKKKQEQKRQRKLEKNSDTLEENPDQAQEDTESS